MTLYGWSQDGNERPCKYTVVVERLPPLLSMKLLDAVNNGTCIPLSSDFVWDAYKYSTVVEFPSECTKIQMEAPVMDGFPKPVVCVKVML